MHVLLVDNNSDDIKSVQHFCKRQKYDTTLIKPRDLPAVSASGFDLAILSGGLWFSDPTQQQNHYANELDFITHTDIPTIGICLGMQLMAAAYGAELMGLKHEYHGDKTVQLTDSGKHILDWPNNIKVHENHTVGVVSAPHAFDVLARSDECLEVIKHRTKPLIGVQFHPEKMTNKKHRTLVWDTVIKAIAG